MSEVKRYNPDIDHGERGEICDPVMESYIHGHYVLYEAYQDLEAENKKLKSLYSLAKKLLKEIEGLSPNYAYEAVEDALMARQELERKEEG